MNFKKLLEDIALQELGNTTDTFDWRLSYDSETEKVYEFSTPENRYEVFVETFTKDWLALDFGIENMEFGEKFSTVTNEGEQFRVVATVLEIAKHAWERRETMMDGDTVKGYSISTDPRRIRLYKTFVKTQFPNAEVKATNDTMSVKITENLNEIGDTTDFYRWRFVDTGGRKVIANFETENNTNYSATGTFLNGGQGGLNRISIEFGTDSWRTYGKPQSDMSLTGEHNQFKVISTVIRITEAMWKNKDDLFENGKKVDAIHFAPAPKKGEKAGGETARGKVYRKFVERQFPNAQVNKGPNGGFVVIPKQ